MCHSASALDARPITKVLNPTDDSEVKRQYEPGERIPDDGVYRVIHYRHRMPHLVTITRDMVTFPYCRTCEQKVCFEPMFPVTGQHTVTGPKSYAPAVALDYDFMDRPSSGSEEHRE